MTAPIVANTIVYEYVRGFPTKTDGSVFPTFSKFDFTNSTVSKSRSVSLQPYGKVSICGDNGLAACN